MRLALSAFLLSILPLTAPATADPVVVELYTSQGCSSCPPADALLGQLGAQDDVIALALHVDYWDYIGWPDTFAQPAFTKRQQGYARAAGSRVVYTPHMVIGGTDHIAGAKPMQVIDHVNAHRAVMPKMRLTVASGSTGPMVMAASDGPLEVPADIILVTYQPSETVDIQHGENAGKSVTYTHIVRAWEVLASFEGGAELTVTLPAAPTPPLQRVVLAQAQGYGAYLATLRLDTD